MHTSVGLQPPPLTGEMSQLLATLLSLSNKFSDLFCKSTVSVSVSTYPMLDEQK